MPCPSASHACRKHAAEPGRMSPTFGKFVSDIYRYRGTPQGWRVGRSRLVKMFLDETAHPRNHILHILALHLIKLAVIR